MPTSAKQDRFPRYDFRLTSLDLSRLVGFKIKVFSEQFPGKELSTRVMASSGRRLTAESGHRHEAIDNLVNHQQVVLQFPYRGQDISIKARLLKTGGGRCHFELDEAATPLSHRRYYRVCIDSEVNLAPFPATGIMARKLGKLRWMGTTAANFSAGGSLISVPTWLHESVRLLVNIRQEQFDFPALVLARVRHCYQFDDHQCRAGIEFVTREKAEHMFSSQQMADMPRALFAYSDADRTDLDRTITAWDTTINSPSDTGANDDSE